MDNDIRNYIIKNLKDCNKEDIRATILSSVNSSDEVILPGLGVLFEMVWNNNDSNLQNNIIDVLYNQIKKA